MAFLNNPYAKNLPPMNMKHEKKVIVIGAGLAGLNSAKLLHELGFHVSLLEASSRPGGRVLTLDNKTEAGAELIGSNHHAWIYLAEKYGLKFEPITCNTKFIHFDDRSLTENERISLYQQYNDILMKISDEAMKITYPNKPWLEPNEIRELENISLLDKLNEWNITGHVRKLIEVLFENNNVSSLEKQSWLATLCQVRGGCDPHQFWEQVENWRCIGGNSLLVEALSTNIDITYNCEIIKIKHYDNEIAVYSKNRKYLADYVVLAVPCTAYSKILKEKNNVYFSPDMYTPSTGKAVKFLYKDKGNVPSRLIPYHDNHLVGVSDKVGIFWEQTKSNQAIFAGGKYANNLINGTNKKNIINWPETQFIGTGYSYGEVGNFIQIKKNLSQMVGRLAFAGEHTRSEFFGYMEGGLISGLHAVKLILCDLQKSVDRPLSEQKNEE